MQKLTNAPAIIRSLDSKFHRDIERAIWTASYWVGDDETVIWAAATNQRELTGALPNPVGKYIRLTATVDEDNIAQIDSVEWDNQRQFEADHEFRQQLFAESARR